MISLSWKFLPNPPSNCETQRVLTLPGSTWDLLLTLLFLSLTLSSSNIFLKALTCGLCSLSLKCEQYPPCVKGSAPRCVFWEAVKTLKTWSLLEISPWDCVLDWNNGTPALCLFLLPGNREVSSLFHQFSIYFGPTVLPCHWLRAMEPNGYTLKALKTVSPKKLFDY